jgi:hypothetical protein
MTVLVANDSPVWLTVRDQIPKSPAGLPWVLSRRQELEASGVFTPALAMAVLHGPHKLPLHELRGVLRSVPRGDLQRCGDPLPLGDSFTVYRGISGVRAERKPDGLWWSSCAAFAAHFATRRVRENPAVLVATVRPSDLYFIVRRRSHVECLCEPPRYRRLPLSYDDLMRLVAGAGKGGGCDLERGCWHSANGRGQRR